MLTRVLLVRANAAENPKQRLSDEEMVAQMSTLTLAGHETISTTLSFLLWELAKAPEYQTLMREEILITRENLSSDSEFSIEELDGMPYTVAAIKVQFIYCAAKCNIHQNAFRKPSDYIPSYTNYIELLPRMMLSQYLTLSQLETDRSFLRYP